MKNEIKISEEIISSKIYWIRNQKIMLDRDLAELYGVENRQLKRQVRRNIDRFPEDFIFELSKVELENWRSQFGTSNSSYNLRSQNGTSSWGGTRYAPMAFTEQGVAMLSSVLNSPTAIKVNIQIIRVFTKMREVLTDTLTLKLEIEEIKKKLSENGKNIGLVFDYLDELINRKKNPEPRKRIGYKIRRTELAIVLRQSLFLPQ